MFRLQTAFALLLLPVLTASLEADEDVNRKPTVVTIDDDGHVRINGKRRYLYGAFRDPSDSITEFAGLKKARFDFTHEYWFEGQLNGNVERWIERARVYLHGAQENGIGVALGLPRDVVEDLGDVETARTLVEAVKDEPALW